MDALPPNDPNRNNNAPAAKGDAQREGSSDGAPLEAFGNMQDSPVVVAMFLIGVATWFLRERCIC